MKMGKATDNKRMDDGPFCDFKTWLEREEFNRKGETDVKKEWRDKVNERDAANGYRVGRGPKETANDWESLRGIDISLRRIADVLEDMNERTGQKELDDEDD